ncbi:MAG: hypothetical protein ACTS44_00510 [Candidatus Hodgkinia cicadicola]
MHLDVPLVRRAIESLITFGGRLKPPSAVQRTFANLRTSFSPNGRSLQPHCGGHLSPSTSDQCTRRTSALRQ